MRELFPDDGERLAHIFANQVFGAAPTEIIYRIAMRFLLGFAGDRGFGLETNFVMADTAALAKEGKLADFVQEQFGGKLKESCDSGAVPAKAAAPSATSKAKPDPRRLRAAAESRKASSTSRDEERGDWLLNRLDAWGIEYVDKRDRKGGSLWVVGGRELSGKLGTLKEKGVVFNFAANGGKATGGRPGWYTR